eukprot:UN11550
MHLHNKRIYIHLENLKQIFLFYLLLLKQIFLSPIKQIKLVFLKKRIKNQFVQNQTAFLQNVTQNLIRSLKKLQIKL